MLVSVPNQAGQLYHIVICFVKQVKFIVPWYFCFFISVSALFLLVSTSDQAVELHHYIVFSFISVWFLLSDQNW